MFCSLLDVFSALHGITCLLFSCDLCVGSVPFTMHEKYMLFMPLSPPLSVPSIIIPIRPLPCYSAVSLHC